MLTDAERLRDEAIRLMDLYGSNWHTAVLDAGRALAIQEPLIFLGSGASSNWIWFANWPESDSALDVGGGSGDTSAALLNHFRKVEYLDPDPNWVSFVRHRFRDQSDGSITIRRGSALHLDTTHTRFGCVSLTLGTAAPDRSAYEILTHARQMLLPGGQLRLVPRTDSRRSGGMLTFTRALQARRCQIAWHRVLVGAGFRNIRVFYVEPRMSDPHSIVPATRQAALAAEALNQDTSKLGPWRRWMAAFGMHWAFHPQYFILAEA